MTAPPPATPAPGPAAPAAPTDFPGPSPTRPIPAALAALTVRELAAERERVRLGILTAPTWKLNTHWVGRQWAAMLAIEAEMRRRTPQPGWP